MLVKYVKYSFMYGEQMTFYVFTIKDAPDDRPFAISRDSSCGFPWFPGLGNLTDRYFKSVDDAISAIESKYVTIYTVSGGEWDEPLKSRPCVEGVPGIESKVSSGVVDLPFNGLPDMHDRYFLIPLLVNKLLVGPGLSGRNAPATRPKPGANNKEVR